MRVPKQGVGLQDWVGRWVTGALGRWAPGAGQDGRGIEQDEAGGYQSQ